MICVLMRTTWAQAVWLHRFQRELAGEQWRAVEAGGLS